MIGGGDISLAIGGLSADPETVSPNGDTIADSTTITYTLNTPANVSVRVLDLLGAQVAAFPKTWKRAGEHVLRFDPASAAGRDLPRSSSPRTRPAAASRPHRRSWR